MNVEQLIFKSNYSVHELSHFDLDVYRSETLPDTAEVAGNLAGLYGNLCCFVTVLSHSTSYTVFKHE